MNKSTQEALIRLMELHGDPDKPIPPGAIFATLPPKPDFTAVEELKGLPYPPITPNNPGCTFEEEERTLVSTVWGKIAYTEDGIQIIPNWEISEGNMSASVKLDHTDFTGALVAPKTVVEHVPAELKKIALELDLTTINHALKKSAKTGRTYTVKVIEGELPVPEQPAQLELAFQPGRSAGTLRKDGTMDFRERAALHSVAEGDIIATLNPPVPGKPGQDIFGAIIIAQDAPKVTVIVGQGVEATTNDADIVVYTATRAGVARYRNDMLEVTDLLSIDGDVDFSTGNIHAKQGAIHIKGDIKSGFTVESDGDVIVDGLVEKANIIAGGLVIAGGVIMDDSNRIEAKGDVSAHFFHNANVKAGGDVSADQDISHSKITAEGKITVLGGKGIISGGHLISGSDIHASIIGNKSRIETCVEIRIPHPSAEALEQARKELEEELHALDKAIGKDFELSSLMSAPEEDRRILAELIKVRSRIQADIRDIIESGSLLTKDVRNAIAAKRIIADQKAYCGTKVIIQGTPFTPLNDMDAPTYRLDLETLQIISE